MKILPAAQAFDSIAPHYDALYGPAANAVMAWMHEENLALLRAAFPAGGRLLEIGCGTGDEALALARAGYTVLATDISPRMAALTQAKARTAGLLDHVVALALPGRALSALRPKQPFDGAYASFGSLNCETDLPAVAAALARLVRPGGVFVCSVMSRYYLAEVAWFLLHARPRMALRRWRRGWQAASVGEWSGDQIGVRTRYLTASGLAHTFVSAFAVEQVLALPLLLPPPYLEALFRRRSLFRRWERWERRLRARWPWQHLGDHLVVVLRRI
jgi:SAM-dependent methyltransferase